MTSPPRPDSDAARPRARASASVLAGALCLSVSAILVKVAGVDAATTAMLRCAIAVLVLIPLALGERRRHGALSRAGIGWAVIAGVALGVDYAAWTAAIFRVGAGISTVLINVQVIVLPLLALLVDRERMPPRFLLSLPLMLLGIGLVGGVRDAAVPGSHAATGTLLGVLAGIAYGAYLFVTRHAARREPIRIIQPLAWASASAAMTTTAIAMLSGGLQLAAISFRSWALLALLAVLGQVVAWLLIHHGSIRLAPATTAALLLIQPILALGLSAAVLSEHPTARQLTGAGLVLVAVAVANGLLRRVASGRSRRADASREAGSTDPDDGTRPSAEIVEAHRRGGA